MKTFFSLPLSLACLAVFPLAAPAQVVPDGSLGAEGSVVVPQVINGLPSDQLEGGAVRGGNLFHSFGEFSVPDGRGAYFANPAGIANIFSRVTGGNISQILGTLGVLGNANLYFLNPNGIIFGPNAQLDVKGSFLATTADSFIFDNGFEFSASNPTAPPLLTVSIPIGLRFRENPGEIVVRTGANNTVTEAGDAGALTDSAQTVGNPSSISGSLDDDNDVDLYQVTVPEGATVTPSTVGGSGVDTRLFLFDQSGLGVVANEDSQGTLQSTLPEITQPGVYYLGISSYANSPLSEGGEIFAYDFNNFQFVGFGPGANAPLSGWDNSGFESGSYTISLSPPVAGTGNLAVSPGQSLALIGGNVRLEGADLSPGSNVYIGGVSGAGVVSLESGWRPILPALLPRADIGLFDSEINVRVRDGGSGSILLEGGNIDIVGESTRVRAGIETGEGFSGAQAGDLEINGTGLITIDGAFVSNLVNTGGVGNGGDILITGQSLLVDNGGFISAGTDGEGNAGAVVIKATESVTITGEDSEGFPSFVSSLLAGTGDSGGVTVETGVLLLEQGGFIDASAVVIKATESVTITGESSQNGDASGVYNFIASNSSQVSGNTEINTGSLFITDGGVIDNSVYTTGNSGKIIIKATGNINVSGEKSNREVSRIWNHVQPDANGNSGGIEIEANNLTLSNGGFISSSTEGNGNASSVNISVIGDILIEGAGTSGFNSSILSGVNTTASGNAGGIVIEAGNLTILEGEINASTLGIGDAAIVEIRTNGNILIDGRSSTDVVGIYSGVDSNAIGNAAGILIKSDNLTILNGGEINAGTRGQGNAGTVQIQALGNISVEGESISGNSSGILSNLSSMKKIRAEL